MWKIYLVFIKTVGSDEFIMSDFHKPTTQQALIGQVCGGKKWKD